MERETKCIICGQDKNGLEVRDDQVIRTVRWFKRNITQNEKGYKLVVCKDDYVTYAKSRKKFVWRQKLYLAIGVIFAIIVIYGAANKLVAVFLSICVVVFIYLLSLLTYMPALNIPAQKSAQVSGSRSSRPL